MKRRLFVLLLVLPFFATAFAISAGNGTDPAGNEDNAKPIPNNAVGLVINGTVHVLTNQVRWTFPDGGQITDISFFAVGQQPYMRRVGTSAAGNARSESFQVTISNGFLLYTPTIIHLCTPILPLVTCNKCQYDVVSQTCNCLEDINPPGQGNGGCLLTEIIQYPYNLVLINW